MKRLILFPVLLLLSGFTQADLPAWEAKPWHDKEFRRDVRKDIMEDIWGHRYLPSSLPEKQGSTLIFRQPWGFEAYADILRPANPNGEWIVFQQGHQGRGCDQNGDTTQEVLQKFLDEGYKVVCLAMALAGDNVYPPEYKYDGHTNHNLFYNLPGDALGPLFLTPVIQVINWLKNVKNAERVHLTGVSGGAWTTMVVCGLDYRLDTCSAVAGTQPYVPNGGDYEQIHWSILYKYMDLYALAACSNRSMQIFHEGDPWFPPDRSYVPALKRAARSCGGRYVWEKTGYHAHAYTVKAARMFLREISAGH